MAGIDGAYHTIIHLDAAIRLSHYSSLCRKAVAPRIGGRTAAITSAYWVLHCQMGIEWSKVIWTRPRQAGTHTPMTAIKCNPAVHLQFAYDRYGQKADPENQTAWVRYRPEAELML